MYILVIHTLCFLDIATLPWIVFLHSFTAVTQAALISSYWMIMISCCLYICLSSCSSPWCHSQVPRPHLYWYEGQSLDHTQHVILFNQQISIIIIIVHVLHGRILPFSDRISSRHIYIYIHYHHHHNTLVRQLTSIILQIVMYLLKTTNYFLFQNYMAS